MIYLALALVGVAYLAYLTPSIVRHHQDQRRVHRAWLASHAANGNEAFADALRLGCSNHHQSTTKEPQCLPKAQP